jgi:hypothetical protein
VTFTPQPKEFVPKAVAMSRQITLFAHGDQEPTFIEVHTPPPPAALYNLLAGLLIVRRA